MEEDHLGNHIGDYFKVEWIGDPVTIEEIRKSVDNCPNCIFSILRQCKFNFKCFEFPEFDYKKELQDAFVEKQRVAHMEEYYNQW